MQANHPKALAHSSVRLRSRLPRCAIALAALLVLPAIVPAAAHAQQDDGATPVAAKAPAMTCRVFTVDDSAVQADGIVMHALRHQWVPRGLGNRELLSLYRLAQSLTAHDPRSHMISHVQELFACSATTYLYGATEQEPFTREKLQAAQPELMGLTASWFGPSAGRHVAPGLN